MEPRVVPPGDGLVPRGAVEVSERRERARDRWRNVWRHGHIGRRHASAEGVGHGLLGDHRRDGPVPLAALESIQTVARIDRVRHRQQAPPPECPRSELLAPADNGDDRLRATRVSAVEQRRQVLDAAELRQVPRAARRGGVREVRAVPQPETKVLRSRWPSRRRRHLPGGARGEARVVRRRSDVHRRTELVEDALVRPHVQTAAPGQHDAVDRSGTARALQ